jgi:coproporphyrinogen III oxidase
MNEVTITFRKEAARRWFESLRDELCAAFEGLENKLGGSEAAGRFDRTPWRREGGGGGETATMRGRLFEKAAVHCSTVHGEFAAEFAKQIPGTEHRGAFWASGISLIAHPWNPHVPTVHMNTRYVVTAKSWFGGGADLTPLLERRRRQDDPDSLAFHGAMRRACEAHAVADYAKYKKWCDDYFFLAHRNEPRGVGGIFFDYLEGDIDRLFRFVRDAGNAFTDAYLPIVRRRMDEPYSERERAFQEFRRGRYVEFNLIYDRGTIFGLRTDGRVESILMSLPPEVRWEYCHEPAVGSPEAETLAAIRGQRDWAGRNS